MTDKRSFPQLRVMAEYGSSGIPVIEQVGPFRHYMIPHSELDLPIDLAKRFDAWIATYWKLHHEDVEIDLEDFNTEGRKLAQDLKKFVGKDTYVEFIPEAHVGLRESEVIN